MKKSERIKLIERYNQLDKLAERTEEEEKQLRQIYFLVLEEDLRKHRIQKAKQKVKETGLGSNYTPPKKKRRRKK